MIEMVSRWRRHERREIGKKKARFVFVYETVKTISSCSSEQSAFATKKKSQNKSGTLNMHRQMLKRQLNQ